MNAIQTGSIVEYGLAIGEIIEQGGEQYFKFAIYDHEPAEGFDLVSELSIEHMTVIGHVDTDSELLEIDNSAYEDVW